MSITTRFAPSPTGYLHLGHAHSALTAWRRARDVGGRFLLRIEDIDRTRCRPEFTTAILEDLAWLGLDWDGDVRIQSEHLPEYRAVLDQLSDQGLLYPCFCTRADIQREIGESQSAPHAPDGSPVYPGLCRGLPASQRTRRMESGTPYALRLDMAKSLKQISTLTFIEEGEGVRTAHPDSFGDIVLARKDSPASYHLCVTHDDARQGVTLVTRGEDLKAATDIHVLLQGLMGWPTPVYAHHGLLTDPSGRRLAKRDRAATLRQMRADGATPAQVRAQAGFPD